MKTKRNIIALFTLCTALSITGCAGQETSKTENTQNTAAVSASESSADDSNAALDDLYQQENQIFADHKDVWDKVFGMMNKSTADPDGNYADYLADTVEANKASFTDSELKTLTDDIKTIRKVEDQITEIESQNAISDTSDSKSDSGDTAPFQNFSGKDFDGNAVDQNLFSGNAVTVINFWFTGCKPCVAELSKLNELNDAAIKEAKKILESQGATYRNLSIDSDSAAGKYAADIMAFPTTILVDRNGNIIGEPMLGGIDNQDNYDALMKQIQSVIDADSANK